MRGRVGILVLAGLCLGCPGSGPGGSASASSTGAVGSTGSGSGSSGGDGASTTSGVVTTGDATTGLAPTTGGEGSSGVVLTTGGEASTGAAGCPERAQRGVWVWQPAQAKDPAKAAGLLAFAAEQELTHVYLESESLLLEDPERLAAFIGEADAACVAVELLFGAAAWAQTENHGEALALVDAALTFVDGLAGARPVGLHFDVEPHGLPDWGANQGLYANQYLDLLEAMAAKLLGSELPLTVDVAFWYDSVAVDRAGKTRPLNELVQDRVDRVVVMDYRDHAEPPDGILDNAAAEVAYAEQIGRRVRIGVETTCGLEPEKVTFCEEGAIAMTLALELTAQVYARSPAWDGVAVHDHAAWSVLMD